MDVGGVSSSMSGKLVLQEIVFIWGEETGSMAGGRAACAQVLEVEVHT